LNALFLVLLPILLMTTAGALRAGVEPVVPEALSPWVDWVLDGADQRACPLGSAGATERVCAWPGRLRLELDHRGGRFEQSWTLIADGWLPLPGGSGQWPQQVSANRIPVAVVEREGQPMLYLDAGEVVIRGRFVWPHGPDLLRVPAEVGLLSLRLNGVEVDQPRLDAQGGLWLGGDDRPAQSQEPDALSLEVMRRIEDSVPLRVQTRLLLEVSGQPRELLLGPALLPGGIPLRLQTLLPARLVAPKADLDADQDARQLQLQLRPGRWELTLESHHPGPVTALGLPAPSPAVSSDWPRQEVWVFAARPELRQVELSGGEPIDPRQTLLPPDWQPLPAYLLRAGQTLELKPLSRGASASDRIRLERALRLDFDGAGLSLRDRLSGQLQERWRIEAEPPLVLGRVSVDGEPRLITRLAGATAREGVEVRGGQLALTADARINTGPVGWPLEVPGSGWDLPLIDATTQLDLPPGWDLLAVAGVDNLPDSWLARWTLLDIFLVLIAAFAVARLWGWPWGLLMLVTLVLTWQEPGAPRWAWLNLIVAAALLRLLPKRPQSVSTPAVSAQAGPSWLAGLVRLYYQLALLVLAMIAIPFMVTELRDGLFPQLERADSGLVGLGGFADGAALSDRDFETYSLLPAAPAPSASEAMPSKRQASLTTQGQYRLPKPLPTLDPDAQLQTGAGVPDWNWRRFELSWSGPMPPDHRLRLWLLPASASLVLAIITLLLVPLLGLRLADRLPTRRRSHQALVLSLVGAGLATTAWLAPSPALAAAWSTSAFEAQPVPRIEPSSAAGTGVARSPLPAVASGSMPSSRGHSTQSAGQASALPPQTGLMRDAALLMMTFPPPALLDELRQRLLAAPPCAPGCAEIAQLLIEVTATELQLLLAVDAAAAVALPVPSARGGWSPERVELDGEPLDRLLSQPDGRLAVPVPSGRHLLLLSAPLAGVEQVEIPLPLRPRLVEANLDPIWELEGVGADAVPGDQLRLRRLTEIISGAQTGGLDADAFASDTHTEVALPPLLKVTRTLRFGLDWGLTTEVERLSPLGQPLTLRVPLIPGESVTTPGIQVSAAGVLVSLPPERARMRWRSALRPVDQLLLSAATDPRLTEEWRLEVSPVWHLSAEEAVPLVRMPASDATALPTYRPWPGERLHLSLSRPMAVAGPTLTLDGSRYQVQPGRQWTQAQLRLRLRTSQAGRHRLQLPEGAEPTRLSIDGRQWPLTTQDTAVDLALSPGTQVIELDWMLPAGLDLIYRPAVVGLGVAGVNAETRVRLGADRWLLWTSGPGIGPAVQFWGLLLVIAITALLLARSRLTPLGFGDWLLLGIGLSQVSIWVGALVVLWLFALGARRRLSTEIAPWRFNLTQIALLVLTIIALGALLVAVQQGLLGSPAMQVAGNGSTATDLNWYLDRNAEHREPVTLISAPIWVYRLLMLAWALWLAWRLLDWLRWGWRGLVEPTAWLASRRQTLKRKVAEQKLSIDL